jgi:hypothetical protein
MDKVIKGRRRVTKLLGLISLVPFVLMMLACGLGKGSADGGSASPRSTPASSSGGLSTSTRVSGSRVTDADDGDKLTTIDSNDDNEITNYGRPATPVEKQSAVEFATRYFRAASAANGQDLCGLITSRFARAIPRYFGGSDDPSYLRGKNCAEIMSKLFRHRHHQMQIESAGFEVTGLRIHGNVGYLLLAFTETSERHYISVEPEDGGWKMSEELIDGPYP